MTTKATVLGIGELLWDFLPDGKKLGGAPANFAYHVGGFGHRSIVMSRLGADALGDEALLQLKAHGLETAFIQRDDKHATGTVQVELKDGHPSYTIVEDVAWDYMQSSADWLSIATSADAVCFGTLAQRHPSSRAAIQAVLRSTPSTALRILDVNLRGTFYSADLIDESLSLCNVFKLNDQELPIIAEMLGVAPGREPQQCAEIVRKYGLRMVSLTKGDKGSLFVTPDASYAHPGFSVTVADTVGAGDAFTAGVAHGLLTKLPLEEIAEIANRKGAWVASQSGAMPPHDVYSSASLAQHVA